MERALEISLEDTSQIKEWNKSFPEVYYECVHHVFEQEVDKHPDAPAVCAWDGNFTYDELDVVSSTLAAHLVGLGVTSGTFVPFCFEKSKWTVVATAAILKAGGAYVPLDPSHPRERILSIIEEVEAKLVVASPSCAEALSTIPINIVTLSANCLNRLIPSTQTSGVKVRPADPVLVFFTSGSTGRPKGIILQHKAIATNAKSNADALGINSNSRVLQFAAHGWDIATLDMWTTLMRGGCVCIPSELDRQSGITRAMERMKVNWVLFTPSFVELINPTEVPSLQTLVIAGEAMKQAIITKWAGHVRLYNAYGPAETGICTVAEYESVSGRAESIGRPIKSNICWIVGVDDHEKLVPIGTIGELLVEGPNLAQGYLNDDAKTNASFIQSPSWLSTGRVRKLRRLYKTGDLAKLQPDGSIDFIGRKDYQVKIRGQRLELGEIENTVEKHSIVSRGVACCPQDGRFGKRLVLVLQATTPPSQQQNPIDQVCLLPDKAQFGSSSLQDVTAEIVAFLMDRLPSHALPDFLIIVRALPLSASAKIDRKGVENWLLSVSAEEYRLIHACNRADGNEQQLTPKDGTAYELGITLSAIIQGTHSERHAAFLTRDRLIRDLGVDSVQYIRILMFIRQNWGYRIPLHKLTSPMTTIGDLAGYIDSEGEDLELGGIDDHTIDLFGDYEAYLKDVISYAEARPFEIQMGRHSISTVFLTGSTGFLGTTILRQLLRQDSVKRVIALVRGADEDQAFQRVRRSAEEAGWWHDSDSRKLDVWLGDLGLPRLGLSEDRWKRLCGRASSPVDTVVHNGAKVHWIEDYHSLKAVNIDSTVELLRATLRSPSISRFIYVSGGEMPDASDISDQQRIEAAVNFNGYAQTKLVSELLVREAGRYERKLVSQNRFFTFKPGYIIGSAEEGIANPSDFLWRLAAGAVEVNGYNATDQSSFLFLSSADRVSDEILGCCLSSTANSDPICGIVDGLKMEEFWAAFKQYFPNLQPMQEDEWLHRLREATKKTGETHPLYPCLHMIEKGKMKLGARTKTCEDLPVTRKTHIQAAVRKNVKYLADRGYLVAPKMLIQTA